MCKKFNFRSLRNRRLTSWITVATATLLVVGGCSSDAVKPTSAPGGPSPATTAPPETLVADGRQVVVRGRQTVAATVTVEVDDNYFKPNVLRAAGGSTIAFQVRSRAGSLHNFSVVGEAVDRDVPPGQTLAATVTVPASGQVVFFCKFHREESGMVGVINAT